MNVGDSVRLRKGIKAKCPEGRENNKTARIEAKLDDYANGAVKLDRDLVGCRYWNVEDLEVIS
jgi:hypothetical protein